MVQNSEEDNSVVEVYLQVGSDTSNSRAVVDLLEQIIAEPTYDVLRTKEQLGYSVHASARLTHGVLGFALVIVSGVLGFALVIVSGAILHDGALQLASNCYITWQ